MLFRGIKPAQPSRIAWAEVQSSEWKVRKGIIYRDKHYLYWGQVVMAPTRSGASEKVVLGFQNFGYEFLAVGGDV